MVKLELHPLDKIFQEVVSGDVHASNKLDKGNIPLIGCGFLNQGVEGYFDLSEKMIFKNAITIACDGSYPLTSFYHNYDFSAKDNVVVCIPKSEYPVSVIYYLISVINRERWRFSYGRKCYITKMKEIKFLIPTDKNGEFDIKYVEDNVKVDLEKGVNHLEKLLNDVFNILPKFPKVSKDKIPIDELFYVLSGGSRKGLRNYDDGEIPYVSSGRTNNSIIGMVSPLNEKEITFPPAITVTAFCQARVQLWKFIGRGNGGSAIKILKPKNPMTIGELFWYASQINSHSWKYNYGIMISQERLKQILVTPVPEEYKIDLDISNIGL